ncbi:hypothetical protein C9374_003762 [Naegleria lovaniensis]|uniref:Centriolar satellite-associated tubulin polyglutamylase complex regulator 1 n=1 Tax=Naegleria lovaniensis TaxID=51637 RepID=A0AA88KQ88_NAELO|nr:uncharacterized protein C9374_003762 [Naegleria lovaniensis]KAG2393998.1 hypothetical protein C9374_003762 [Naegleria lovaniensis]
MSQSLPSSSASSRRPIGMMTPTTSAYHTSNHTSPTATSLHDTRPSSSSSACTRSFSGHNPHHSHHQHSTSTSFASFFHHEGEEYLKRYQVHFYLNDVLSQLLFLREEDPMQYLAQYFRSVVSGTNIIHKSFSYIFANPRNRLSFADYFEQIYSKISNEQKMNFSEYYQLTTLLCEDFPENIMTSIYKSVIMYPTLMKHKEIFKDFSEDVTKHPTILSFYQSIDESIELCEEKKMIELPPFQTFIVAMRVYLFFYEFFEQVLENVFENSYSTLISSGVLKKMVHPILTMKSTQCVPSMQVFDILVEKSIQLRRNLVNSSSNLGIPAPKLSFCELCEAFYQHVVEVSTNTASSISTQTSTASTTINADVLSLMDSSQLPISVSCAERQKLRLRKEILKVYSGVKENNIVTSNK